MRHVQVEQNDVGLKIEILAHGLARIGDPADVPAVGNFEDALEKTDIRRFVIHDEDFGLAEIVFGHKAMSRPWPIMTRNSRLNSTNPEKHVVCLFACTYQS